MNPAHQVSAYSGVPNKVMEKHAKLIRANLWWLDISTRENYSDGWLGLMKAMSYCPWLRNKNHGFQVFRELYNCDVSFFPSSSTCHKCSYKPFFFFAFFADFFVVTYVPYGIEWEMRKTGLYISLYWSLHHLQYHAIQH